MITWFWKAEDDADRQVKGYQGKGETSIAHLFTKMISYELTRNLWSSRSCLRMSLSRRTWAWWWWWWRWCWWWWWWWWWRKKCVNKEMHENLTSRRCRDRISASSIEFLFSAKKKINAMMMMLTIMMMTVMKLFLPQIWGTLRGTQEINYIDCCRRWGINPVTWLRIITNERNTEKKIQELSIINVLGTVVHCVPIKIMGLAYF